MMNQEVFVELMALEHPKTPKRLLEGTAKTLWDPSVSSFVKWTLLVGVLRLKPHNAALIIRHADDIAAKEKEATAHEVARLAKMCCEMWQGKAPKGSGHAILVELLDAFQGIALMPEDLPEDSTVRAAVEERADAAMEAWKAAGFPGMPK